MEQQRIQKLIANYGFCSRRKAEELIKAGKVKVNSQIAKLGDKATEQDKIEVEGKILTKPKRLYLLFNKPPDCVTTLSDPQKRKTIFHYLKELKQRVIPVGRLDFNTSGLLLLTNHGDFANKVMHPRYEINKTYQVLLNKPLSQNHKTKIENGIPLEDGLSPKTKLIQIDKQAKTWELTLHEGKKRIVRRIFQSQGFEVISLTRTAIENIKIDNLPQGKYRELTNQEINSLLKIK